MTVTQKLDMPPGIPNVWREKQYRYHWPYRAEDGSVAGHAVRFEGTEGDKEVIPFFRHNGTQWKTGFAGGLRPLFGLEIIADTSSDTTVYVAEGEKATQTARQLDLPCVTSPGGSKAADKAD